MTANWCGEFHNRERVQYAINLPNCKFSIVLTQRTQGTQRSNSDRRRIVTYFRRIAYLDGLFLLRVLCALCG